MKFEWQRLNTEYARQFRIEATNPHPNTLQEEIAVKIKVARAYVNDVQLEYDRMKPLGAEFTMPPAKVTGSTIAMLNDTCGNLIQIVALDRRQS